MIRYSGELLLKMMKSFTISLLLIFTLSANAQKVKTIDGEYTYYAPENVSLEEAKRLAFDRAIIQALAKEFGTNVSQDNETFIKNIDGQSQIEFLSIAESAVKGEWLQTIGDPFYEIFYADNHLVVTCRAKGKAREITRAAYDLKFRVLRNGTDDKFESSDFRDGDDLYVSFQSPVKGFLAIYYVDDSRKVYLLLPYNNQDLGAYPVEANRRYVFFSSKDALYGEQDLVDEYEMRCERSSEFNQLYLVFSPNEFAKASDTKQKSGPLRELTLEEFYKWLNKCRSFDKEMNVRLASLWMSK